jgi:hypothetical protein
MLCAVVPELTKKKTTLPLGAVIVAGANWYSVITTLIDPAGWATVLPPHPASIATAANAMASALN